MTTIAERFDPRNNSLNAIRLILALTVIVLHSWPLGGWGDIPDWHRRDIGNSAVAAFFVISGYLITASRLSAPNAREYFRRRILRIYPGFLVALVAVSFVFGPFYIWVTGRSSYDWTSAVTYITNNFTLYIQQWGIDGTLQDVPYPNVWNGSIWTLYFEALCYIGISVVVSLCARRFVLPAMIAGFVLLATMATLYDTWGFEVHPMLRFLSIVGVYFCAGSILFLLKEKIPLNGYMALGAFVVCLLSVQFYVFQIVGAIPFAYIILYLGAVLPLKKLGRKHDFSYGMYIYAVPIQQILVSVYDWTVFPIGVYGAVSIVLTAPFAVMSWFLIERPAMRLKRRTRTERITRPVPDAAEPSAAP